MIVNRIYGNCTLLSLEDNDKYTTYYHYYKNNLDLFKRKLATAITEFRTGDKEIRAYEPDLSNKKIMLMTNLGYFDRRIYRKVGFKKVGSYRGFENKKCHIMVSCLIKDLKLHPY
jgi:hypothetical protein